jgi:hypothetical protein
MTPSRFPVRPLAAGLAVLALLAGWYVLRPTSTERSGRLPAPWEIVVSADGRGSEALGVRLGETTLGEVRRQLGGDLVLALIEQGDGRQAIEAFAARIDAGFVSGALVLAGDTPVALLQAMRARALRSAPQPSGARRWTLAEDDQTVALTAPVAAMTFLPAVRLDEAMLTTRFGPPAERRPEGTRMHHLYPRQGLDVVIDDQGKTVLQYVRPADFGRLVAPLPATPASP